MRNVSTGPHVYSIDQVAELTGTTVETLRMWEHRYGWPRPDRQPNGYRVFYEHHLADIRRFVALVASGHKHRSLIVNGLPTWPPTRQAPDFTRLARLRAPERDVSARYQRLIVTAVIGAAGDVLQQLLIEVACLVHPLDRGDAAWLPTLLGLAAWDGVGRPVAGADDVRCFIRDQAGPARHAELLRRVLNDEPKEEG